MLLILPASSEFNLVRGLFALCIEPWTMNAISSFICKRINMIVPMDGGGIWRDVVTHYDSTRSKTYAYVGAQGNQGDGKDPNLFVIDLSNLSGNEPHAVDENPVVVVNLGKTPEFTHTINVARSLLFLNTATSKEGCRVYDLVADPMNPRYLFKTGGSVGRDCHDSSVVTVGSRDLLIVSDGTGRYDIGKSFPHS